MPLLAVEDATNGQIIIGILATLTTAVTILGGVLTAYIAYLKAKLDKNTRITEEAKVQSEDNFRAITRTEAAVTQAREVMAEHSRAASCAAEEARAAARVVGSKASTITTAVDELQKARTSLDEVSKRLTDSDLLKKGKPEG